MFCMHIRLPALLAAIGMLTSGCTAVLVGAAGAAGGIVYVKGQLESYEVQSFDTVVAAVRETIEQVGFGDTKATIRDDSFSLRGKDAGGSYVFISATRKETSVTRLRVRHGVVGDEAESRKLLEAIRANYP